VTFMKGWVVQYASFWPRVVNSKPWTLTDQKGTGHVCPGYPELAISSEVSRGEKMALRETDPAPYITQYALVYEDKATISRFEQKEIFNSGTLNPES